MLLCVVSSQKRCFESDKENLQFEQFSLFSNVNSNKNRIVSTSWFNLFRKIKRYFADFELTSNRPNFIAGTLSDSHPILRIVKDIFNFDFFWLFLSWVLNENRDLETIWTHFNQSQTKNLRPWYARSFPAN